MSQVKATVESYSYSYTWLNCYHGKIVATSSTGSVWVCPFLNTLAPVWCHHFLDSFCTLIFSCFPSACFCSVCLHFTLWLFAISHSTRYAFTRATVLIIRKLCDIVASVSIYNSRSFWPSSSGIGHTSLLSGHSVLQITPSGLLSSFLCLCYSCHYRLFQSYA